MLLVVEFSLSLFFPLSLALSRALGLILDRERQHMGLLRFPDRTVDTLLRGTHPVYNQGSQSLKTKSKGTPRRFSRRAWGLKLRVQVLGFRVWNFGFRVSVLGFRVSVLGCWV